MKPSLPKGTRDFGPKDVVKRNYIFETVKATFIKYGFAPIETPAMEALQTLTGKYGEEGDQLLFKVLNNGDYLSKADTKALADMDSSALTSSISKRGLRYDLTVPFARFVVMNQNDIQFPFKRYQIQPVWRADRPQKGRYQEFYQCDVDVVGSTSLLYEAELVQIYSEVFSQLGIGVKILINNRKVLYGISEQIGATSHFVGITVAIDKLDKIGKEGVHKELSQLALDDKQIDEVFNLLTIQNLQDLDAAFTKSETGKLGVAELQEVFAYLKSSGIPELQFEINLARGLGYYTGCIFEVKVDIDKHPNISMGSIGGGGRYDNLTGAFGLNGVSGVGVSFGAERIFDVMEELHLFPKDLPLNPEILLLYFDKATQVFAFEVVTKLRQQGVRADIYPEVDKIKKQIKYADQRGISKVGIIGDNELATRLIMVKDLISGEQVGRSIDELVSLLKK